MSGPEDVCPICTTHTDIERVESMGLVITSLEANLKRDVETIRQVADQAGPLEYHMSISLMLKMLCELEEVLNFDVDAYIAQWRAVVNDQLANRDE